MVRIKNEGQKLYIKAKKIIPGGNQFFSKRPEMFLPNYWPSYYKKSQGIKIWDLNNNCYQDFSLMSIGQCPLGYSNKIVNKAVKQAINNGSTSTLNSFEEVELAEKLINLHKGMQMVRFAKTGGEACSIAIRIARAATGRSKVVASGYFGWHDWYLASNLKSKNSLNKLLLKGLDPKGVPRELKGTTIALNNGDIKNLKKIFQINKNKIAALILEVQRNDKPNFEFIKLARKLCSKYNSVLIFDEISSGFRINTGGIYLNYNLKPDMVLLGKALGNGFPISAILGKKEIMSATQKSFISSSYWTERLGFVAANKTIEEFKKNKVGNYLNKLGKYYSEQFNLIVNNLKLNFQLNGISSVPLINFNSYKKNLLIKTIFTQEMLKKNYLASNLIYLSLAHNKKNIDRYMENVFQAFSKIKNYDETNNLKKFLKGPICHSSFKRLT